MFTIQELLSVQILSPKPMTWEEMAIAYNRKDFFERSVLANQLNQISQAFQLRHPEVFED